MVLSIAWYRIPSQPSDAIALGIDGQGCVHTEFMIESRAVKFSQLKSVDDSAPAIIREVSQQMTLHLAGHLAGDKPHYDHKALLDMHEMTDFRRNCLMNMAEIPYGSTLSYSQLAAECGNAKASRAVGSVCANNPLPLIFPCHRVLPQAGGVGSFGGGVPMKKRLLHLEGYRFHNE